MIRSAMLPDRLARLVLGIRRDEDQRGEDVEDDDRRDERDRDLGLRLQAAASAAVCFGLGVRARGRGLVGGRVGCPIVTRQAGST